MIRQRQKKKTNVNKKGQNERNKFIITIYYKKVSIVFNRLRAK